MKLTRYQKSAIGVPNNYRLFMVLGVRMQGKFTHKFVYVVILVSKWLKYFVGRIGLDPTHTPSQLRLRLDEFTQLVLCTLSGRPCRLISSLQSLTAL